jgi:hypothetical protein
VYACDYEWNARRTRIKRSECENEQKVMRELFFWWPRKRWKLMDRKEDKSFAL